MPPSSIRKIFCITVENVIVYCLTIWRRMMELFLSYILPGLGALLALQLVQLAKTDLSVPKEKRIALLIAHPDDEAMFFAPTVIALTRPPQKNRVEILCLSSGEVETLKETRRKELQLSASILGLDSSDQVTIMDDARFADGMRTKWQPQDIARILSQRFGTGKKCSIDILITFDGRGVSSHPNHISLYHGARQWAQQRNMVGSPLKLYSLTTTPLIRKYISILDVPITLLLRALGKWAGDSSGLVFVNGPQHFHLSQQAMREGHVSQMLWFRWGWIGLSRYMHVNDLAEQRNLQHAAEEAATWLAS